jgi:ferredoxin
MLDPDKGVVIACDLCNGTPKCIEYCPEEALSLVSDDKCFNEALYSTIENLPKEIERMSSIIKSGRWESIFTEAEERNRRLEEKLKALKIKGKPRPK